MMATVKMVAMVVVTSLVGGGLTVLAAVADGTDEQRPPNTVDAVKGQTDEPKAADTVKQPGEGRDCMRRMQAAGNALAGYSNTHNGCMPRDLGSAFMYMETRTEAGTPISLTPKEKAERFLSPKDAKEIQVPEQPTPEWINQHTSFFYLGTSDIDMKRLNADSAAATVLYEKRKAGYPDISGRIPMLFVDGHVEAHDAQQANQIIAESRKTLEAARVLATSPAK